MLALAVLTSGGLVAGLLLLRRVPRVPLAEASAAALSITVIIPARNEEVNLPGLLDSLRAASHSLSQVLVVDDDSSDATAAVATQYGATVLSCAPLPAGWIGKSWACHQGGLAATTDALLFLDADTRLLPGGLDRLADYFATLPPNAALSVLPFHRTRRWYEQLSLFFNILMAMGAGGFARLDPPHLFGQMLLVRRELYLAAGGHAAVRQQVLENFHFAADLRAAGATIHTSGGRGAVEMRMFPAGLKQLSQSWQKGFAAGAAAISPAVLTLSFWWLGAASGSAVMLIASHTQAMRTVAALLYLTNAVQIGWYGRQLGTFRWITATLYPIPLAFYFANFARSAWLRISGSTVTWRGRQL